MEFTHYYGRHKHHNKTVAQTSVAQKTIRARMSGGRLARFERHKNYSGLDESKFLRQLIDEALNKRESDSWQEETKEMSG